MISNSYFDLKKLQFTRAAPAFAMLEKPRLLIREREDKIGMAIKRIASSYVYYYNHKYSRDGHLFRERFNSEPVDEITYFCKK